jgi:hypothetical protein
MAALPPMEWPITAAGPFTVSVMNAASSRAMNG